MPLDHQIASLNPMQREAVLKTEGPVLVLAGAGSGKTRVITARVAYLIETGVPAGAVLAVTFTNKAAREMRARVAAMTGRRGQGRPVVSTFHSLCLAILRREIEHLGYRKDFTIYDTGEQTSLLRGILSDIRFSDKSFKVESLLERISRTKNMIASSGGGAGCDDDLGEVSEVLFPKYHEALKALNALDFDDLLLLTIRIFKEHPEVLEKYRDRFHYLMVDEYQDTNRVQYEFVRLLAGERRNLCVVGDDDQSIYGWRGANLGNILDFERDFPGTAVVRLEQNYRSFGNILTAANGVIQNNRKRMEKALWTDRGSGPKVKIIRARDNEDEARWVADRISMIKYEKGLSFEDFAVIYRANLQSRPFEEALRRLRIPYSVVGGMSYFENREIKDLAAYLKVIANPKDDLSLLRAANAPKRGLGPTALGRLSDLARQRSISLLDAFIIAEEAEGIEKRAAVSAGSLASLLACYRDRFGKGLGMADVFRSLSEEIGYRDYVSSLYKTPEVAMRKIENVEGFIASLARYEADDESPSLHGFLETLALDSNGREREEKHRGVTLISFHSAKGLEFPVVFIVAAEEDIIPHRKSVDDIEEERRLFYVGITRAMQELYITHAAVRERYGKDRPSAPSRFLDEMPAEAVQTLAGPEEHSPDEEERAARAFFSNIKSILGN